MTTDIGSPQRPHQALRVFISYSRAQVHFADELELALRDKGFDVMIDRHSIAKGEAFQQRLGDIILACDTVVFILSDESAASEICAWEVQTAKDLSKRMLVVTLSDLSPAASPPPALAGIDWIHCWRNPAVPGSSQMKGILELDTALRTDVAWLRERTRLQEQAALWRVRGGKYAQTYGDLSDGGASSSMLLRGNVLVEALEWARRTPPSEDVPADIANFLDASEAHEVRLKEEAERNLAERERALKAAGRATAAGGAAVAVLLCGALWLGWVASQSQFDASGKRAQIFSQAARSLQVERPYDGVSNIKAIQLALYGDPAAERGRIDRLFAGDDGFKSASAALAAAVADRRLEAVYAGLGRALALSPDGSTLLFASARFEKYEEGRPEDGGVIARFVDVATGSVTSVVELGRNNVTAAAFSPDGMLAGFGTDAGSLVIWDRNAGSIRRSLKISETRITDVAFSPAGRLALVAGGRNIRNATLWDLDTGEQIAAFGDHENARSDSRADVGVYRVGFTPDGRMAFTAGEAGLRVWDMENYEQVIHFFSSSRVSCCAALSGDGDVLAAASFLDVGIYNIVRGDTIRSRGVLGRGDEGGANYSLAMSFDNQRLLIGQRNEAILQDARTGDVLERLGEFSSQVDFVAFEPNGRRALVHGDGLTTRWNLERGALNALLESGSGPINTLAYKSSGDQLLTSSAGEVAQIWTRPIDGEGQWSERAIAPKLKLGSLDSVQINAQRTRMIGPTRDNTWPIIDLDTGEIVFTYTTAEKAAVSLALSADGGTLAAWNRGNAPVLIDLASGEQSGALSLPSEASLNWLSYSEDGARIRGLEHHPRTQEKDGWSAFVIWESETGERMSEVDVDFGRVDQLVISPDETLALTTRLNENAAWLWDLRTGTLVAVLKAHEKAVTAAAFGPSGSMLVTGSRDRTARIWDTATGTVLATLEGHDDAVWAVAFSPDGTEIATGSRDGSVRLWETPPILLASAKERVKIGCETLSAMSARLSFLVDEVGDFPILANELPDPDDPTLLWSPCRVQLKIE